MDIVGILHWTMDIVGTLQWTMDIVGTLHWTMDIVGTLHWTMDNGHCRDFTLDIVAFVGINKTSRLLYLNGIFRFLISINYLIN